MVHWLAPVAAAYLPTTHRVQSTDPVDAAKVPKRQLEHAAAPAAEYWPRAQFTQRVDTPAPVEARNLPATQLVQLSPAIAYLPAMQLLQSTEELDPVLETNLPAAQLLHADDPASAAYCPATQSVQAPPGTEYLPGLQTVH